MLVPLNIKYRQNTLYHYNTYVRSRDLNTIFKNRYGRMVGILLCLSLFYINVIINSFITTVVGISI